MVDSGLRFYLFAKDEDATNDAGSEFAKCVTSRLTMWQAQWSLLKNLRSVAVTSYYLKLNLAADSTVTAHDEHALIKHFN